MESMRGTPFLGSTRVSSHSEDDEASVTSPPGAYLVAMVVPLLELAFKLHPYLLAALYEVRSRDVECTIVMELHSTLAGPKDVALVAEEVAHLPK